jgi:hypothetical protein
MDKTRISEHLGVVRDGGLASRQGSLKVTTTDFILARHNGEQPKSNRVAQGTENSSDLFSIAFGERCISQRRTAEGVGTFKDV